MFHADIGLTRGRTALLFVALAVAGCDRGPYKDFVGKPVDISYGQYGRTGGCVVKATRDGIYFRELRTKYGPDVWGQQELQASVTFMKDSEIKRVSQSDDFSCP